LPRFKPHRASPGDPRLFTFNDERSAIVAQVVERVADRLGADSAALERSLLDFAYHEAQRLERQHDREASRALPAIRELGRRVARSSDAERLALARSHAERLAHDVAGNFDPRVYAFAAKVVPELVSGVLEPGSLARRFIHGGTTPLAPLLAAQGATERARRLAQCGVVVFVPTHS
jgi:glycerol-3-phosphate O-acyltransferase